MYKDYVAHIKEDSDYKIGQEDITKLESDIKDITNDEPSNFVSMFTDEKTGEFSIPSMDEVVENDPDFLQHSVDGPKLTDLPKAEPIDIPDQTKVMETLTTTVNSSHVISSKSTNKKKKKKWWFIKI